MLHTPEAGRGRPSLIARHPRLAPTFRGQPRKLHGAIFWEHEGNKAVRQGNWKLVSRFEKKTWELYDIAADRSELNDLAAAQPAQAAEIVKLYDAWPHAEESSRSKKLPRPALAAAKKSG